MTRKKIVFVIVEGPSDADALDAIISRILDKNMVHVHIVHGDLTTENGVTTTNVISRVVQEVQSFVTSNPFSKRDFKEIIHIVDTDGTFVPDECVLPNPAISKVQYSLTEIRTNNPAGIIERNHRKAANLNKLFSCSQIWAIPYKVYYMSCNLDHVLYNKLNCNDEEKRYNALQFARRYKDDLIGFLAYISTSDFSVMKSYKESWDFIKESMHSLERHTNLGLFFEGSLQDLQ